MTAIRRIWVTRAEPGATRTADRLTALGFEPVIAPLLATRSIPQAAPDLTGVAALAFTSANGVAAFASLTSDRTRPVFTVGDATAGAARTAGFARVQSASGDLDSLAALLSAQGPAVGPLLVPGALEPAGDLPALLRDRVEARALPLYEAVETGAAAPAAFDAVLVHSARAARALAALGPFAGQLAFALSAAAADPLGDRSGLEIRLALTPDENALLAALGNPLRRV
ncbi:uroporphyrinogen-III synthase [Brevundimonas sp.]|uniref:uroporphyrinogen-III synthase n=1 Tax=Brevundimonas sp. TaxID=1871086 RepID=UPI003F70D3EF